MRSLQRRVIIGGLIWAVLATIVGAFALVSVFNQIADRRFNEALLEHHIQLIVALANAGTPEDLEAFLALPAYQRVYSGRYWQINRDGAVLSTSPSLFDFELPIDDTFENGFWEGQGPQGSVRGYTEKIVSDDGTVSIATVATSLNALASERQEMQRNVTLAFSFVAVLGVACAALLTTMLLAPLRKLRHDVVHRWDSGKALRPEDYPTEVAPLVADINGLIERNRKIHDRGRRQAADLAHALKTPSSALRNELVALSRKVGGTEQMFEALDRIDGQITRSLARIRAASAAEVVDVQTDVAVSLARLERLFRVSADNSRTAFEVKAAEGKAAVDRQDFEEMLGNLLDNAFKWCAGVVRLTAHFADGFLVVSVEDDGPGIDEKQREIVLEEGARLDTSVPGTGLGLSIVNDLSQAYGGMLELSVSGELGGLKATLRLPTAAGALEVTRSLIA